MKTNMDLKNLRADANSRNTSQDPGYQNILRKEYQSDDASEKVHLGPLMGRNENLESTLRLSQKLDCIYSLMNQYNI